MSMSGHRLRRILANSGEPPPTEIGQAYGGGFYYGDITIGGVEYYLVIADKSAEASLQWKTENTLSPGTDSTVDGWYNTNNMNNALHPAAKYCRDYLGGDFSDWYLWAPEEVDVAYANIRPEGTNTPTIFKIGNDQALIPNANYWTSLEISAAGARSRRFNSTTYTNSGKTINCYARPIRRVRK